MSVCTSMIEQLSSLGLDKALTWSGFVELATPLAFFAAGILLYAIVVFHFYKLLARRDILKLPLKDKVDGLSGLVKQIALALVYFVENILIVPVLVLLWSGILAAILAVLSKDSSVATVMLVSVSLVGAVRAAAYYKEELSQDLAKMIPFALLGVFLVDLNFISLSEAWSKIAAVPEMLPTILAYFLFIAGLEIVLLIIHLIVKVVRPSTE
jgi:hypothetical protein